MLTNHIKIKGNFLSNIERNINEIRMLGLDVTILFFSEKDAALFKKEINQFYGIDSISIKSYNGIKTRRKKHSYIVANDPMRINFSRRFELLSGFEIF